MKVINIIIANIIVIVAYSQPLLTIGEVFDFDQGDEFHRTYDYRPPNAQRIKILSKTWSTNLDTVFYRIYRSSYWSEAINGNTFNLKYHFSIDTFNSVYTSLNLPISSYDIGFNNDTLIDTSHCSRIINGYLYQVGTFEPWIYMRKYGKGLGIVYDMEHYIVAQYPTTNKLTYYSKIRGSCGDPDNLDINKNTLPTAPEIYPNPCTGILNLEIEPDRIKSIVLVTSDGIELFKTEYKDDMDVIDLTNVKAGNYFLLFIGEDFHYIERISKI